METGIIFDIERFSIHDGPGIRTTVFFKGCPLNCWWCHNPESQSAGRQRWFWDRRCIQCQACVAACAQGAISLSDGSLVTDAARCVLCGDCAQVCPAEAREMVGRRMTVADVMAEIKKDIVFYDQSGGGVTFSGGEPLMQPDFLDALLARCKREEIHTTVDTSGLAAWKTLEKISRQVDLFLYDLKTIDEARHWQFTGVSNAPILENLRRLSGLGHALLIRIPVIPTVNADDESVRQLGDFIASLPRVNGVELLRYHRIGLDKYDRLNLPYSLPDVQPPSDSRMAEIAELLRQWGLSVKQGG